VKIHIGRLELAALIGLVITLGVSSVTGFMRDCAELRQEVLRIHILADSDQEADQAVKLQVRDAVLEAINQDFSGDGTLEGTIACLEGEMDRIEETANEVLAEAGMPYQAKAELTEMYFTTREYERDGSTFSMPAGRYQALRITLGSGEGHNWWCVAYPPMCIDAAVEGQAAVVEQEILDLGQTPVYKPKLALVEWVESLREAWEQ
jgi:hypothetical protein